jgi:hypothetical protein
MGLAIIGFVLGAMGVHYVLRAEGIEDERRKAEEEAEAEGTIVRRRGVPEGEGRPSWLGGLRGWWARGDADEEAEPPPPTPRPGRAVPRALGPPVPNGAAVLTRSRLRRVRGRRGRPRPVVRRTPLPPPSRRARLRRRGEDQDADL